MGRRASASRAPEEWEELGKLAIMDLLEEKFVAPWVEAEARISARGWKDFDTVQPVQLSGARRSLRDEGRICEEVSAHTPPVHLVRLPYPDQGKRELTRLVGRRRKAYRKYLSWAGDQYLCGKQGERVVLASMQDAASEAGLYVPSQTLGEIDEIKGLRLARGRLDAYAHIMDRETATAAATMVVEVKNVNVWIYPRAQELWTLLLKAAELAQSTPVVPVLTCVRYAYQTQRMASDLGFFVCAMRDQVFSPKVNVDEFQAVANDFGLLMIQHEGPLEPVTSFFTKTLRRSPPMSEPRDEPIEWFRRQAERFRVVAPIIERYPGLAEDIATDTRRKVFASFAVNGLKACVWPTARGWS